MAVEAEFTLDQLRAWLALELTRAETSFVRSQIDARLSLARDLHPGHEHIAAEPLEISRLDLSLALVAVHEPLPHRLRRALRQWWRAWRKLPPERPALPHFRFAADSDSSVRVTCVVQRDARGRFRSELSEA